MSTLEQKFLSLFSPLPVSVKARILSLLSENLAKETANHENQYLEEDLKTSEQIRQLIESGKMSLYSEEEYWAKIASKGQ